MSDQSTGPSGPDITTVDELTSALGATISSAHENGVDFEGSYAFRNGPSRPDFAIEVYKLSKQYAPDSSQSRSESPTD